MATKPINTAPIEKGTGKSWKAWVKFLDSIDAKSMPHKDIAQAVFDTGDASGWWAQSITVAYEQHIGRRVPGQDGDGKYQVSVTKTLPGSMDDALKAWQKQVKGRTEFSDVEIARRPEVSKTGKWRWWRCGLADGTRISVGINDKSAGKAGFGLAHEKLETPAAVEHWRAYWKELLSKL